MIACGANPFAATVRVTGPTVIMGRVVQPLATLVVGA